MAIIKFKAADLRRVVEHALAAPSWRPSYDEPNTSPTMWLVGDQGVYLMSAGDPADSLGEGKSLYVCYAEGLNPGVDAFGDWWDKKRSLFGGDDFSENLTWCTWILQDIDAGAKFIKIGVSETSMKYIGGSSR